METMCFEPIFAQQRAMAWAQPGNLSTKKMQMLQDVHSSRKFAKCCSKIFDVLSAVLESAANPPGWVLLLEESLCALHQNDTKHPWSTEVDSILVESTCFTVSDIRGFQETASPLAHKRLTFAAERQHCQSLEDGQRQLSSHSSSCAVKRSAHCSLLHRIPDHFGHQHWREIISRKTRFCAFPKFDLYRRLSTKTCLSSPFFLTHLQSMFWSAILGQRIYESWKGTTSCEMGETNTQKQAQDNKR